MSVLYFALESWRDGVTFISTDCLMWLWSDFLPQLLHFRRKNCEDSSKYLWSYPLRALWVFRQCTLEGFLAWFSTFFNCEIGLQLWCWEFTLSALTAGGDFQLYQMDCWRATDFFVCLPKIFWRIKIWSCYYLSPFFVDSCCKLLDSRNGKLPE